MTQPPSRAGFLCWSRRSSPRRWLSWRKVSRSRNGRRLGFSSRHRKRAMSRCGSRRLRLRCATNPRWPPSAATSTSSRARWTCAARPSLVFYEDASGGVKKVVGQRPHPAADPTHGSARLGRHHSEGSARRPADHADFDVRGNIARVERQCRRGQLCEDVMRGERLVVDMTTGISRMEGRVDGVLDPKSRDGGC